MESIRARVPVLPLVGIGFVVLLTLGNAAANVIPVHRPTVAELQRNEQLEIIAARSLRIAELRIAGDHCWPASGHELVRLLAMNGLDARGYADDYEARCGADPVVRHWGDATASRSARSRHR